MSAALIYRAMILAGALLLAATPSRASPAQDYMLYCMGCHGVHAEGVPGKVPPLAHSLGNYMKLPAGRDFVLRVPGASRSVLTDAQLAGVLNWLAQQYSAEELDPTVAMFTTEEVAQHRHQPLAAVLARRKEVIKELNAAGITAAEGY